MTGRVFCALCNEVITRPEVAVEWGPTGLAHRECALDYEPSEEELDAYASGPSGPAYSERQAEARKLK